MAIASLANDQGSGVLVNKPGIKDQSRLDAFEREASALRLAELKDNPVKGNYDQAHLQAIHGQIFQDVYDWAGQLRSGDIAKGAASVLNLPKGAADLQKAIADVNYLRGMDRDAFSAKMGELYKQVNDLKPFQKGNGRTTRAYFGQLAEGAGYKLNYSGVSRQEWNNAVKESAKGNLHPIQSVFNEISTSTRAVVFDKLNQNEALAQHPELDGAFKKLHEVKTGGKDVEAEKAALSKQLHLGKIVDGGVTPAESLKVIYHAAKARGLTTQEPGTLGTKHAGTVVAQSTHHTLLKVDDNTAIRFDRKMLDPDLNLKVGDKLTLQHQELKQARSREVPGSNGMERVATSR
jgi:cell filamentation protein